MNVIADLLEAAMIIGAIGFIAWVLGTLNDEVRIGNRGTVKDEEEGK